MAGPENRPVAATGGGPSFREVPLTSRPISGRCVNLGCRETFPGNPGSRIPGPRGEAMRGGPKSFRRRVFVRPNRASYRRFRAQPGPENRPAAATSGGPSFRAIPNTCRPISGRRENLGFRGTFSGNPDGRISGSRQGIIGGGEPRSFRRRVFGRLDRASYRRFRAQTGPGNRPVAPAGGGPSYGAILPTRRPISGRCVNLRFRETLSGNPDGRISGPRLRAMGGS